MLKQIPIAYKMKHGFFHGSPKKTSFSRVFKLYGIQDETVKIRRKRCNNFRIWPSSGSRLRRFESSNRTLSDRSLPTVNGNLSNKFSTKIYTYPYKRKVYTTTYAGSKSICFKEYSKTLRNNMIQQPQMLHGNLDNPPLQIYLTGKEVLPIFEGWQNSQSPLE